MVYKLRSCPGPVDQLHLVPSVGHRLDYLVPTFCPGLVGQLHGVVVYLIQVCPDLVGQLHRRPGVGPELDYKLRAGVVPYQLGMS